MKLREVNNFAKFHTVSKSHKEGLKKTQVFLNPNLGSFSSCTPLFQLPLYGSVVVHFYSKTLDVSRAGIPRSPSSAGPPPVPDTGGQPCILIHDQLINTFLSHSSTQSTVALCFQEHSPRLFPETSLAGCCFPARNWETEIKQELNVLTFSLAPMWPALFQREEQRFPLHACIRTLPLLLIAFVVFETTVSSHGKGVINPHSRFFMSIREILAHSRHSTTLSPIPERGSGWESSHNQMSNPRWELFFSITPPGTPPHLPTVQVSVTCLPQR